MIQIPDNSHFCHFIAIINRAQRYKLFLKVIIISGIICNFAIKMANLLRLDKKRNKFLCFVLDFS